jgi:hypothetical protein
MKLVCKLLYKVCSLCYFECVPASFGGLRLGVLTRLANNLLLDHGRFPLLLVCRGLPNLRRGGIFLHRLPIEPFFAISDGM